jgi:hypothetical protein
MITLVLGVRCGYKGLLEADFSTLSARDVGGTLLIVVGRRKGPDQSLFRLAEMLAI